MDSYKVNGEVKYAISGDMTEFEDILIDKGITTRENILLNKGVNPNDVSFVRFDPESESVSNQYL